MSQQGKRNLKWKSQVSQWVETAILVFGQEALIEKCTFASSLQCEASIRERSYIYISIKSKSMEK